MKTITTIITVLLSSVLLAQELPQTTYDIKGTELPMRFKIEKNNRFSVHLLDGSYTIKNDSIYFKPDAKTSFNVQFSENKTATDSLQLKFTNNKSFLNYCRNIYYGINKNSKTEYKRLSYDELYLTDEDYHKKTRDITIPKTDTLYLAFEKRASTSGYILEKYALPKNTNKITVNFLYLFDKDIVAGTYSKKENYFVFKKDTLKPQQNITYQQPTIRDADFTSPLLKNEVDNIALSAYKDAEAGLAKEVYAVEGARDARAIGEDENVNRAEKAKEISDDLLADMSDYATAEKAPKTTYAQPPVNPFEYSSLKKALKSLSTNEVLVVVNQLNNKNSKQEYTDFIKKFNEDLRYSYALENDKNQLRFYLATEKDQRALKKYQLKNGVSCINSYKDVLYYNEQFKDNSDYFFGNDIYNEIRFLQAISTLNNEVEKQTINDSQLVELFTLISSQVYNLPQFGYKIDKENHSSNINDLYYGLNEENTKPDFQITATPKQVTKLFEKLVKNHSNDKTLDIDYVNLLKDYISRIDYFKMLFNKPQQILDELDFEVFDYVLKFNKEIIDTINSLDARGLDQFDDGVPYIIQDVKQANNKADVLPNINTVFNKILELKNNSPDVMKTCLQILRDTKSPDILEIYNDYFSKTFDTNTSIIEQLNDMYPNSLTYEWTMFKENFAKQCNEFAWEVYTTKNKKYLNEAIQWSKTSLKVEKKSPHFLDTLAHLYFIKGEKEKAIQLQEQAVKYARESSLIPIYEKQQFEEALAKMKQ